MTSHQAARHRLRVASVASVLSFFAALFSTAGSAAADKFEQQLSDANTKANFSVDTTWHTVEGNTAQVSGKLWEETPGDDSSLRAELRIPVSSFDTDSSSRDKELRSSMSADKYPNVTVQVLSIDPSCRPSQLPNPTTGNSKANLAVPAQGESCRGKMQAQVTICDVSKTLALPYELKPVANGYQVSGSVNFEWLGFHVKDPSIFIAKVHKDVQVNFSCLIEKSIRL